MTKDDIMGYNFEKIQNCHENCDRGFTICILFFRERWVREEKKNTAIFNPSPVFDIFILKVTFGGKKYDTFALWCMLTSANDPPEVTRFRITF